MTLRNALLSLGCTLALATSAMAADPLKIGLMEDVSGDLAVLGKPKLNGSLLREGCVDELLVYLAPKLIGSGLDIASQIHADGPLVSLAGALPLEFRSADRIGPDLRIVARVAGRDAF